MRGSEDVEVELLAAAAGLSNPGEGWPDAGTMTLRLAGALGPLAARWPPTRRPRRCAGWSLTSARARRRF